MLDKTPLFRLPIIFLFPPIDAMTKIKGIATTPFITAAKTKAFIGLMPIKFNNRPIMPLAKINLAFILPY